MLQSKIEALPQLIPVLHGSDQFVRKWKRACENILRNGMNSSRVTELDIPGVSKTALGKVYHWEKKTGNEEGMYFASENGKSVDFLYYYCKVRILHLEKKAVAEALAFRFNENALYTRGLLPILFFDFLLPRVKFVVTDSVYSMDGQRWFYPQYRQAFANPGKYTVYALDTSTLSVAEVTNDQFQALQSRYWGSTEEFQRYRFAISTANFHLGD